MKIEIWSDVVCPFCYIGKRNFEQALAEFNHPDLIDIEWKSFQLSPDVVTDDSQSVEAYLAAHKGISLEQAKEMNLYVTNMAAKVGLQFNFDHAVMANTLNAHQMLHFAKKFQLQSAAKERLMQAYFTEGKNIDDLSTLLRLGEEIGLDTVKLQQAIVGNEYLPPVKSDIAEAQQLGIQGVPFFVFDRRYGISGAQPPALFLKTLEKCLAESRLA